MVPDGQTLDYCYMREVWDYTREYADYETRKSAVEAFNRANKWIKRGIALLRLKYGSGYNATFLEQAGALLEVYSGDGSILVRQGGVEIGQGLHTIIAQVSVRALNVPLILIQIAGFDSAVVPNVVSTGASTGTGFNAEAVTETAKQLRKRLSDYTLNLLVEKGEAYCKTYDLDLWNYAGGWRHVVIKK